MDRIVQIKAEMQQLEDKLEQLKEELTILQLSCNHEFKSSHYAQQCTRCQLSESLNW